jgi:anthranilate synthase component 2
MNALLIDAYDSFVYIIVQYFASLGVNNTVKRNDEIRIEDVELMNPDLIVLGPGPGHPSQSKYIELINQFKGKIPILGICLGHQAIGMAFGSQVGKAQHLMHGKVSEISHDGAGVFKDIKKGFKAMRYHSLIIDKDTLSEELKITATSTDHDYIMGVRHKTLPIESLQFHPESILTEDGIKLLDNFLKVYVQKR